MHSDAPVLPGPDSAPLVRLVGRVPYAEARDAMRAFTLARDEATRDEIWLVEHDPVFTQGIGGDAAHVLAAGSIPVVATERGGQVTYHGPGQVVAYTLVDLKRLGVFVKEFVFRLEAAVLDTLADAGLTGHRVRGAPGIYVRPDDPFSHAMLPPPVPGADPLRGLAKIAALGIKVSRHCTWHGVALNVAMDLEPFGRINPCGYAGLRTVDLAALGVAADWGCVAPVLGAHLARRLAR